MTTEQNEQAQKGLKLSVRRLDNSDYELPTEKVDFITVYAAESRRVTRALPAAIPVTIAARPPKGYHFEAQTLPTDKRRVVAPDVPIVPETNQPCVLVSVAHSVKEAEVREGEAIARLRLVKRPQFVVSEVS